MPDDTPSQGHDDFVEPTRDEIPKISADHVKAMESTDWSATSTRPRRRKVWRP